MTNKELTNSKFDRAEQGILGAKNLLPLTLSGIKALNSSRTWNGNSCTHNGITFTVNVDYKGNVISITESGTATEFAFLRLANVSFFNGAYILNKGISDYKFIYIQNETTNILLIKSSGNDAYINLIPSNDVINCIVGVVKGQTGEETFYPMLRLASDPDDTYVPYAMTNREITEKVNSLFEIEKHTSVDYSFSDYSNIENATSIKNGILVQLRLTSKSNASVSGTWTTLGVLKPEYRPDDNINVPVMDAGNGAYIGWGQIKADGTVNIYQTTGSAKTIQLYAMYFLA
jgi:hypothetical protein